MAYNTHISIGCLSETNVVSCSSIGLLAGSKMFREVVGPSPYGAGTSTNQILTANENETWPFYAGRHKPRGLSGHE